MKQTRAQSIIEFRRAARQPIRLTPTVNLSFAERALAYKLILEELFELAEALSIGISDDGELYDAWDVDGVEPDVIAAADAFGDLMVVVEQLGPTLGMNADAVFEEVHRSNMSKVDPETGYMPVREDGKAGKGPNFFEPDLERVLLENPMGVAPDDDNAANPEVDVVFAPSRAVAKSIVPVEFPGLAYLTCITPIDIGRGFHTRELRHVYLLPGVDTYPNWKDMREAILSRQEASNLGGEIFELVR